mmetsp:Transcript_53819/g.123829  ORF Transcript_53819/g.123829 Transcript_53819/m.123829 type:complete len:222 (+) Transcript_53819:1549-2214(+)
MRRENRAASSRRRQELIRASSDRDARACRRQKEPNPRERHSAHVQKQTSITIGGLQHLGVYVEAREPELCHFLREQLDAVDRIAENDRLVDCQLGEERVQAVHLLPLLHKCVELCHAFEGQFLHQIDLVWSVHEAILEDLDLLREGGGEEQYLPLLGHVLDDLLDQWHEFWREKFVRLVKADAAALAQIGDALLRHVAQTPRRRNDDMHRVVQPKNIVLQA